MRLADLLILLAAIAATPTSVAANDEVPVAQAMEDRAAIQNLVITYMFAVDQIDPDLFTSLFTQDAEFHAPETPVRRGHQEIRPIVGDAAALRDRRIAEGGAMPAMRHILSNSLVTLTGPDSAFHKGYWTTEMVGPDGIARIAAMGWYEDDIVKENGVWLISKRRLYLLHPERPIR